MHRTICGCFAAAGALACLVSCGRGDRGKTIEIALVTKALDSEWWQRVKAGAEEAARVGRRRSPVGAGARTGGQRRSAGFHPGRPDHAAALRRWRWRRRALRKCCPVLDRAKSAGIPVLIVDTDVNWPSKLSYIGADNRRAGRLAGEYIVKLLGGKGKVAVIRGILGIATHEDRLAGFQEALAGSPRIECVAVQPANSERTLGMSVMENLLTSHPDLKAVFATNDQMALGAVEAVAARNLTGQVAIVGVDATSEAVRAIQAGRLAADVAMHPEALGRDAVLAAIRAARKRPVEPRIDTGETLVTRENAAQFSGDAGGSPAHP